MLWAVLALSTAIFGGAGYAISEKIMHTGMSPTVFLLLLCIISLPIYATFSVLDGSFLRSIELLSADNFKLGWLCLGACMIFVLGNLFIFEAISLKDATHANILEITYPIFTILFTYIFFKNVHLDWTTALGGILILCGTALIIYKGA